MTAECAGLTSALESDGLKLAPCIIFLGRKAKLRAAIAESSDAR